MLSRGIIEDPDGSVASRLTRSQSRSGLMASSIKKPGTYLSIGTLAVLSVSTKSNSVSDGGISGLSALYILDEICARVQFDLESKDEIRPCDRYDVIGGTGTGA